VKLGTPFATLLEMAGGVREGRKLKAVIPGGSSMPVLPGEIMMATDMDYDSIAKAGSMLGSGAVIVMDDTRCMVKSLLRLSYFYYEESCGQCTPCRVGTAKTLKLIAEKKWDQPLLKELSAAMMDASICGLGQAAPNPVLSVMKYFPKEVA
jgi:NADH-quinone oxidoreductase subunit F